MIRVVARSKEVANKKKTRHRAIEKLDIEKRNKITKNIEFE